MIPLPTRHGQKLRILILAGSNRRQFGLAGVDSKARSLALRMRASLPADWWVDWEDLGNRMDRPRIQSCNACVSTSMALCCWPCNCYHKDARKERDLMWDLNLYARLELADAWAVVAPVNWYGPTSNLKLLFDRLVCINGGNPKQKLIDYKNPEKAMRLEKSKIWNKLSLNHLEGRSAAFFSYGDGGGDEIGRDGRPKMLVHKEYFDSEQEPFHEMRQAYAPIVWQCRASGIEVPDELWTYSEFGQNKKYSENQAEHLLLNPEVFEQFDSWIHRFKAHVLNKGKAPIPKYSAVNYRPPVQNWQELKLKWREVRVRAGKAPRGSSPRLQHDLGLNRD